ncbi:hypothetical protein C8J57DRAFT_1295876 [Mycena rebaudengoi]|nr:hypothetical protein C8J57DRAFT_1295876 [Mycena rebaudengoi]
MQSLAVSSPSGCFPAIFCIGWLTWSSPGNFRFVPRTCLSISQTFLWVIFYGLPVVLLESDSSDAGLQR